MELSLKAQAWMKDLLVEANVPAAKHGTFTNEDEAIAFLSHATSIRNQNDGLAAGKGVIVTESVNEQGAIKNYLSGDAFGDAGRTVVIEEGLRKRNINTSYL